MAVRDQIWLEGLLDAVWQRFFSDVEKVNPVEIKWGRRARFRFGSIRLAEGRFGIGSKSAITVTRMFQSSKIPERVVAYTVAHELAHYAHGFSSKHARASEYPHAGSVVDKELVKRGMTHIVSAYKTWLKSYRQEIIDQKLQHGRHWWWM